jgi:hypothetical protein
LEERDGVPITVRHEHESFGAFGLSTSAWTTTPFADNHLILVKASLPEVIKPHVLAHELAHLDLNGQAMAVGKYKLPSWTEHVYETLMQGFEPNIGTLALVGFRGYNEGQLRLRSVTIMEFIHSQLLNIPVDMVVETMIKRQFPVLGPAQYVCASIGYQTNTRGVDDTLNRRLSPRPVNRAIGALHAALQLFRDNLFEQRTNYFAAYQHENYAPLARQLVDRFETMFPPFEPAREFDLIERFVDLVELGSMNTWVPVAPLTPISCRGVKSSEASYAVAST